MKLFWKCEWCHAGGSVEVKADPSTATRENAAPAMDAARAIERQHERSPMCHVMRALLWVCVSTKAIKK